MKANFLKRLGSRNSNISLRMQILLPILMTSFLFFALISAFQFHYETKRAHQSIQDEVSVLAKFLKITSSMSIINFDLTTLDIYASQAMSNSHVRDIIFYSKDFKPITKSIMVDPTSSETLHTMTEDILGANETVVGRVEIKYSTALARDRVFSSMRITLLSFAMLEIAVLLMVLLVTTRASRPLTQISDHLIDQALFSENTSQQLNDSSEQLSATANQQASSVQETVSSITEMASMVEQTIQHIKNANELGASIGRKTEVGSQTLGRMSQAMNEIQSTTSDLKHIVQVIEGISEKTTIINDIVFKTQLLAFNASIEAARAGQHGKGFSVVADEVRDLSNLAGQAANEIESLIHESHLNVSRVVNIVSERISEGEAISRESLQQFMEIADDIKKISASIDEVYDAGQEQYSGISQTVKAMDQLNESAQNNAAAASSIVTLASEVRNSSHFLQDSGRRLSRLVVGSSVRNSNSKSQGIQIDKKTQFSPVSIEEQTTARSASGGTVKIGDKAKLFNIAEKLQKKKSDDIRKQSIDSDSNKSQKKSND